MLSTWGYASKDVHHLQYISNASKTQNGAPWNLIPIRITIIICSSLSDESCHSFNQPNIHLLRWIEKLKLINISIHTENYKNDNFYQAYTLLHQPHMRSIWFSWMIRECMINVQFRVLNTLIFTRKWDHSWLSYYIYKNTFFKLLVHNH